MSDAVHLPADTNQALGIARYAIDFLASGDPSPAVLERTTMFFTDAAICGVSALAAGTNAPTILRREALGCPVTDAAPPLGRAVRRGATVFGSRAELLPERAIAADCAAVREWDSNGTNFGYDPARGNTAGEFGHNDFYAVCTAGARMTGADGAAALRAMVCHDEIRGRLAEVFSLKSSKIDHVLHGAIASAAVFGAMLGATPEQIESAIGMVVAHFVPFRAIRAGHQLSDSKGASAAISTEAAIVSVRRSMMGFLGPRDIFRNPEAVFRLFEGPGQLFVRRGAQPDARPAADASPFDLHLSMRGEDFTIMGMHFKLGLYEHQSAGAIQALLDLLAAAPDLLADPDGARIRRLTIRAYEPAFGIIGDPAKRHPTTRQSADHSMVYIIATLLRKALRHRSADWATLMLLPEDYADGAIADPLTRALMDRIVFEHGGPEYDRRYPDGIPTSMVIEDDRAATHDSGLVMYPTGHARNTHAPLRDLLATKFRLLGRMAAGDRADDLAARFRAIATADADAVAALNDFEIAGLP